MEIKQCTFKTTDEQENLVELQNEVYRKRGLHFTKNLFKFWYVDNPVGGVISYNAFDNGKMIAHQSFVPELMCVDGRVVRCLRSMAVVTHPSYQGKGIFSRLTNCALEEAQRQGYEFVYAITNGNSTPSFIKYCGFRQITRLQVKMGVGTNLHASTNKTYSRYWTPELLVWRLSHGNYFRKGRTIVGSYKYGVGTIMGTMEHYPGLSLEKIRKSSPLPKLSLYVGLGAVLPKTYFTVPKFIKHSPFNLIFKDLTDGKLPEMTEKNVFYQLIDYDVA